MSILVVLEQQSGQWHRMSWETLAAAQQLGETVEAAVVGKGIGALANEAAAKKLAKVWAVEHDLLDSYTADGYAAALEQLIRKAQPKVVLFPHTYQVRVDGALRPGVSAKDIILALIATATINILLVLIFNWLI